MIKIKNMIFPESELEYLYDDERAKRVYVKIKAQHDEITFYNITILDIQWNYEKEIKTIREIYNDIQIEKRKTKEIEKDQTFEHMFNNLSRRCKNLIDYVDDLKDNKQIDIKIANSIKSKIQCGY